MDNTLIAVPIVSIVPAKTPRSLVEFNSIKKLAPFVKQMYKEVREDISEEEFKRFLNTKRPKYLYFREFGMDKPLYEFISFGKQETTYLYHDGGMLQTSTYKELYLTMKNKGLFQYHAEGFLDIERRSA
jgi:hypothetical protein